MQLYRVGIDLLSIGEDESGQQSSTTTGTGTGTASVKAQKQSKLPSDFGYDKLYESYCMSCTVCHARVLYIYLLLYKTQH